MTLILTLATYEKVVQVSDRRLTDPNGRPVDDEANKAVCVSCQDASFSIAYTNLAYVPIKGEWVRTDRWLVDRLTSMDAYSRPLIAISKFLDRSLTAVVWQTPGWSITLVLAGYWDGEPFLLTVSSHDEGQVYRMKPYVCRETASALLIHGWRKAVDNSIEELISELRRTNYFNSSTGEQVARKLVALLRDSSLTPSARDRIGRNCMSVVITPKPDFPKKCNLRAKYHPEHASPIAYGPHFITQMGAFSDIEFGS